MGKGEGEGMATTWNHYLEDRLVKLERRQERLAHRLQELSEHPVAAPATEAAPTATIPPADPIADTTDSLPTESPTVAVTTAHAVTVSAAPASGASRRLPPLSGGQGASAGGLGIWKPGQSRSSTSGRDRRRTMFGALQRVHQTSLGMRQGLMRVEAMLGLFGQLMQVVSNSGGLPAQTPPAAQLGGFGGHNALAGAGAQAGQGGLAGLGGLGGIGALLGALGGAHGGGAGATAQAIPDMTALASPTSVGGYAAPATEVGSEPAGGEVTFNTGPSEMQKLQTLMPLLQQLSSSRGGLPTKLASLVTSPAFQQLLGGLKS